MRTARYPKRSTCWMKRKIVLSPHTGKQTYEHTTSMKISYGWAYGVPVAGLMVVRASERSADGADGWTGKNPKMIAFRRRLSDGS